ncbi:hypothetical protein L914_18006 [Phytophthora nicotianae]|uniref:Uncharacterized protein n=1 Tax=Phytophthora nicotianae TaxID=4792 RepID=W2MF95_PHYNI|nr:hypothetical protein L914_18006 [Phytophthora nicotianae]
MEQRDSAQAIQNQSGGRDTGDQYDGLAIAKQMEGVIDELFALEWKEAAELPVFYF